jgi:hypothetical protein
MVNYNIRRGHRAMLAFTLLAIIVLLYKTTGRFYACPDDYPHIDGITADPQVSHGGQAVNLSTTVSFAGSGSRECTLKTQVFYLENGRWTPQMTEIHDFVVAADRTQRVTDGFTPSLPGSYKYTARLSQSLRIIETQEVTFSAER